MSTKLWLNVYVLNLSSVSVYTVTGLCTIQIHMPETCPHKKTIEDDKEHWVELYEERLGGELIISSTPMKDADGKTLGSVHVFWKMPQQKYS
jgi:hypothetical protein